MKKKELAQQIKALDAWAETVESLLQEFQLPELADRIQEIENRNGKQDAGNLTQLVKEQRQSIQNLQFQQDGFECSVNQSLQGNRRRFDDAEKTNKELKQTQQQLSQEVETIKLTLSEHYRKFEVVEKEFDLSRISNKLESLGYLAASGGNDGQSLLEELAAQLAANSEANVKLQEENIELKQQLFNLSENFDCLNTTVNEIMKREAIRDRGIKIPCPSTDEYDELMDLYATPTPSELAENVRKGKPSVEIVVATDLNGVIGVDGKIPWDCPEDRKLFKELTVGHVVVMGRKTYDSLPEQFKQSGLPGRTNIIMSRDSEYASRMNKQTGWSNSSIVFSNNDPEFLMNYWKEEANGKIFIIGGEEIYKLWMPYVDVIHLSKLDNVEVDCSNANDVARFIYEEDNFIPKQTSFHSEFSYTELYSKSFYYSYCWRKV